jgi:mannose/cellobiose epimerase-like protein (N-acyl-D-glucosamine 2-epimerase family)
MAVRGVEFLRNHHRDPATGGYDWLLEGTAPIDRRRVCYGHAFVMLAYARATEVGIDGAKDALEETSDLIVERFWDSEYGLCRSRFSADWSEADDYRGQNANMHTCEAMLAAYEVTGDSTYLERAREIAHGLTVECAATNGRLWEHYTPAWEPDMEYNRDDPHHQFRPWGYQPGHHAEWAKLLAILDRYVDDEWPLRRAEELFELAVEDGWDESYGGFYYTVDTDGDPVVTDKYGWAVAEAIGAAAALFERTADESYSTWYDRLWAYADANLVAPGGNWYEKCTRENDAYDTEPGPAVEPGYHPIGACVEAFRSLP